tara:strand:+ start:548 stop:823 length:276 start_codon:yes stop_codon:yes gene_type:complete
MPETAKRLDRIEEKLDRMGDVLVSLARFEEKMDAYNEYRERSWERMNKFSEKLDHIDKTVADNARTVHTINKLFWIGLIAISGSIAAQLWM